MDFDPIIIDDDDKDIKDSISDLTIIKKDEVLSVSNLLTMTKSHIEDDAKCRQEIADITEILSDNKDKLSPREILEFLKIKTREREFHVNAVFKAYNFILRTELAKEYLMGSNKKERVINMAQNNRVNDLVNILKNPQNFKH